MSMGRTILSATLAVSLAACGGGDGGGSQPAGPVTGGSSGGNTSTTSCTLAARQDWARDVLDEWYLFPDLLDRTVNRSGFSDVQSYLDALVAPARAQQKDRFFTYITSIQEENDLINNGSNAGFGIRLVYDTNANRVFVAEAFETGPAFSVGFDRGTEIISIDGQSVASLMAAGGSSAVSQALGPSDPGVTRTFVIRNPSGVQTTVTASKADYALDPISDRYGVQILNDGTGEVGYVNLRTFIVSDASDQLRDAFRQFQARGITKVILDLRYNGGGLVSVAELLGDLMAEGREGQVFSRTELRASKSSQNSTETFRNQPEQIAVTRLAVIGRGGTASASELVTNSFIPYLRSNLALIGTNTFGKPVGQFAFDRSACDDRLRAVAFKTVNSAGNGEYFQGLAGVMDATCRASDDLLKPFDDPSEASIATALDFLAGRSCTPISGSGTDASVRSVTERRELLQPAWPTAAQFDIPGIF